MSEQTTPTYIGSGPNLEERALFIRDNAALMVEWAERLAVEATSDRAAAGETASAIRGLLDGLTSAMQEGALGALRDEGRGYGVFVEEFSRIDAQDATEIVFQRGIETSS